jgi:SAM-dependent methyltransferase
MEQPDIKTESDGGAGNSRQPHWALQVFDRSLKKRQKLDMLLRMAGPFDGHRCLLITCGDNPGALNHHFRAAGGTWTWAEVEPDHIDSMSALLGEPVHHVAPDAFPFGDASFDRVVVIDVHEHLEHLGPVNREIARVTAPGGLVVLTTPNGDTTLPLARLKSALGMTPEAYGHQVQGYTSEQLEDMARSVDLVPEGRDAYSRFFTEGIELVINFGYVKVLSRKKTSERRDGEIAPSSSNELERVGGAYRLYSSLFPVLRAVSRLDALIPGQGGYAVAIAARKSV